MNDKKRVVFISDLHCGHRVGLTPPKYQTSVHGDTYYRIQVETYDWYKAQLDELQPIHTLFINGDCVDGPGTRSGGTELLVPVDKQCDMAIECIKQAGAQHIVMTYGTPYHVGINMDAEDYIAKEVGAKIHDHAKYEINGTVFDVKHKVGGSTIPHGRGTPIAKDRLWDLLWAELDGSDPADVIIRSHVHYYYYTGQRNWLGLTTHALQGLGSKYGARQCAGTVDCGFVYFDCYEKGEFTWGATLLGAESQKRITYKL